ncbi:MAG: cytochrome c biogenesis protein ResB [Verrucomicrobia bacterium]|nr:cytochrome c biogenesis protein ResB [Verrucomicrobiota bacterium]
MNSEEHQKKADSGHILIDTLASLKLTVLLLILSMILILLGTLEQVHWGIWHVQKVYFSSWLCFYPMDPTAALRIPLPAGFTLGALLIINLAFAHVRHFKATAAKVGNLMIHAGLLLLLGGGFVTAIYQEESAMIIPEGEQRNYSEAFREFEIALVQKSATAETVVAIPDSILRDIADKKAPSSVELPGTPYTLVVQTYHPNAMLRAKSQMPDGLALKATQGIGARTELAYKPLPESYDDNKPNAPTAIVELKTKDKSLGTWALNLNLTESFDAQTFEDAGKTHELSLRRTRYYIPFTVQLDKFTHEKYPGTETPKRFASDVTLKEGASSFPFNISMNQPLRHAGLTFFQSSFGNTKEGKNLSVLQVVRNPGWLIPYISVALMSLGLVWHFGVSLLRFLRGRAAKAAAVLTLGFLTATADAADAGWNTREFGEIPVQSGGRVIPIETLATGSLLQMRSRTSISLTKLERVAFGQPPSTWTAEQREEIAKELPALSTELQAMLEKRPVRLTGGAISSVDWLIEVSFRAPIARHLPTFRVEHPNVLKRVGGNPEKSLYVSWDGILKNSAELSKAAEKARSRAQADRDTEDRALLQLESAARQYATLSMTFIPGDLPADVTPRREYAAWIAAIGRAIAEMNASATGKAFDPELQKTVKTFVERYQDFEREGVIGLMPPKDETSLARWDNLGASLLGVINDKKVHRAGLAEDGIITRYADFSMAWREGKDDDCARLSSAIAASLKGPWSAKAESEASFGRLQPFYWLLIAYVVVVLMVLVSWVTGSETLRVWGYRLLLLFFILHTAALGYRMWLHGRPPVTNLYSTGIFVAWGAVGMGILLERVWKNGIGAVATGITGFVSLIVAHNLGLSGEDNLESVRAVLDTNFWLATHVTIVTLGYSATFVAGLLGALHLALRAFKKDYNWGDSVARAAYGILAFAVMASFIGTMLGGIWADQSWGRFWGWDPKENGAILIVLWCALCLHARWGGLVRREGLMQLLVFGNMVTAWSWFGTNLLGVGLHSYGFTESGFFWLMIFWASQLALIALGWFPDRSKSAQAA